MEKLKRWLEAQLSKVSAKSQLAANIAYTLGLWTGLTRFLEDGHLELDTNPVETLIKPLALTRKNALFAVNDVGAENRALLASLVATGKLNGVNPFNYIHQTLRIIFDGYPRNQIEQLMPWNCDQASSLAA